MKLLIRTYESGAHDIGCPQRGVRKITYNNGDVVYSKDNVVIKIIPHDFAGRMWYAESTIEWNGRIITVGCLNPDTSYIDAISVKDTRSEEAKAYDRKQTILNNLRKDPRCYDNLVRTYMSMQKSTGKEKEDQVKIKDADVYQFFNLPQPSPYIKVDVSRSGAITFDVCIRVQQNPALQDTAADLLDKLLSDEGNKEWLIGVHEWHKNYPTGISGRSFSGLAKEAQVLLQRWFKALEQKIGREKLTIINQTKV